MRTIYFDHNATTPLDPAVREAMMGALGETFGNPSSIHHVGRRARVLLDEARERVARVWGCRPSEVIFTSGGTESVNLAIFGTARRLRGQGRHLVTSAVEHHAVLHPLRSLAEHEGFAVTHVPVDSNGRVDPADVRRALRPDTILVSVMAANNEVGTIQPVAEIGRICAEAGVLFHTDAVQWFGKEPFTSVRELQADLVSLCAHKFHGPKGAGVLFLRSPLRLDPLLLGGAHEAEQRAGTENLAAVLGLATAMERFLKPPVFGVPEVRHWTRMLEEALLGIAGVFVHARGSTQGQRLCNTVAFSVEHCDSVALLASLDLEGICASGGAACSSGLLTPSHVLLAMGVPPPLATSLIRFSLGRDSTAAEVRLVTDALPSIIRRVQQSGAHR